MNNNHIIQGLWIGKDLSIMEQLSISSFLKNGHDYHLYTYQDLKEVPTGTTLMDGNEILPESQIFSYKTGEGKNSYSAFSNFFRYKLLLERGGWWADTDMVCLKPLDFDEEYVFSTEHYNGTDQITSGLIKAPKDSEILNYLWQVCLSKDPNKIVWGEVGPRLVSSAVDKFSLSKYAKSHKVFMPLGFEMWMQFLMPNIDLEFKNSYTIHLWNEMWRRSKMDKDKKYSENCLYEKLKRKYL